VDAGEPLREIALSYAVDHSTISRLKARHATGELNRSGVKESATPSATLRCRVSFAYWAA
jgi:hypothetical protein